MTQNRNVFKTCEFPAAYENAPISHCRTSELTEDVESLHEERMMESTMDSLV